MSSVVVITPILTPLVVAGWPFVTATVTAAVASLGFSVVAGGESAAAVATKTRAKADSTARAEIDLGQESEVLADATGSAGGELVVERDGVRAVFTRDARNGLRLCVEGEGHSKAELRRIGEELVGRVTQQYVYHRVVTELQERHMTIVDEQVGADRTVKIRVRNL